VGHYEQDARRKRAAAEPGVAVAEPTRAQTSAAAVLALQRSAGNRAVAAQLQRYKEHPNHQMEHGSPTAPRKPRPGSWKENGVEPKGTYMIHQNNRWYAWSTTHNNWTKAPDPTPKPETPKTTAEEKPAVVDETPVEMTATEETPVEETTVEEQVPEKPKRVPKVPENAGHFTGKSTTTMKLGETSIPDDLVGHIFGYLGHNQLVAMRGMDRLFREYGSSALRQHVQKQRANEKPGDTPKLKGLSALGGKSMLEQYQESIKEREPSRIVVASDQISERTVHEVLGAFPGAVQVFHGSGHNQHGTDTWERSFTEVDGPYDQRSKMHNKAVVGTDHTDQGEFLISGSPNLTKSGMETNTESSVVVRYPGIASMYQQYIDRIRKGWNRDDDFSHALEGFNDSNPMGIRAALAPFVDIGERMNAELEGADKVVMRMFLVGSVQKDDPVDTLCALARNRVDVTVVVDRGSASSTLYVRQALEKLRTAGVKVQSETGKGGKGIMHDKLVLSEHKNESGEKGYRVMIGSSGLTKNVIENRNYENLLVIDDEKLFKELMIHHAQGDDDRSTGIPPIDPSSVLGRACKVVEETLGRRDSVSFGSLVHAGKTEGLRPNDLWDGVAALGLRSWQYKGYDYVGY
jgi:PLD-like domain